MAAGPILIWEKEECEFCQPFISQFDPQNRKRKFIFGFGLSLWRMGERIFKYGTVFLVSMFKFVIGPTTGIFAGLSIVETALISALGMSTSVVIFSYGGVAARDWWFTTFRHDRKLFSPRNRKVVKFWIRYGIKGLAFLTPVVFSPIVGTLLAISFGESKTRIFRFMALSALIWGFILSIILFFVHKVVR